jgi:hypothetical protein
MQVNEINTSNQALNVASDSSAVSAPQGVKDNTAAPVQNKADQNLRPAVADTVVLSNKPAGLLKQQNSAKETNNQNKTESASSHVIEEYNAKGELRVKFVDNKNNIIYQIPSEMVAKMQDLMMKSDVSADAKA